MDITALWPHLWPYITLAVAVASTIDAALPQPAPGSHWLILRKLISFVAVNVGNASNGTQPSFVTWIVRIATPVLQAQGIAPNAPEAPPAPTPTQSGSGPAAAAGALLLALLCTSGLSACSTAGTSTTAPALTQAQTDQRTAYKELVFARLAVDDAAGVAGTKGMSPDLIAKIKAGGDAVASAIGTQTTSLESDGSIGSQSLAAVSSALDGALHNLGPILTSAHGTSATPLEMAMAGGQAAMSDVPAVIALVANLTDPSWVPTSDVLKQAAADLTAAQARLDAVGNPAPAASS